VHAAVNDGIPVLYMMSRMIPHQQQCLTAISTKQYVPRLQQYVPS
jgi:hypothetical protein